MPSRITQPRHNPGAVNRLTRELAVLEEALESVRCAVVAYKPDRRIDFATVLARRWLKEYFDPHRADRLPEAVELWVRQHQSQLPKRSGIPPPLEPLAMEREGRRLLFRLLSKSHDSALLLEEQSTSSEVASLVHLGLTRRETEVLACAALGKTNTEIGTMLGISSRTAQSHLEHVYHRLGVCGRTAAVAKALQADRSVRSESDGAADLKACAHPRWPAPQFTRDHK